MLTACWYARSTALYNLYLLPDNCSVCCCQRDAAMLFHANPVKRHIRFQKVPQVKWRSHAMMAWMRTHDELPLHVYISVGLSTSCNTVFSPGYVQRVSAFWKMLFCGWFHGQFKINWELKGFLASRTRRKRLGTDALRRFGENSVIRGNNYPYI